ncbi:MAG TPA: TAT-variant-translocated molybdopterin oxidoreductase [Tepidisphaeraceae bacterium]|jgi:molybdopterin-containing oxidoreductase family iron-sulfur binding subunit|nr:TAT-variant-translocated molybdopterin oxidoreductase [Tepidisphaeraceae bacterium]
METSSSQSRPQRSAHYWKSLEQWSNTPEFRRLVQDEFPPGATDPDDGPTRRTFLKTLAASMALASLTGCKRKISETIVPYVRQPAEMTPGRPLYFATSMTLSGYAQGVIATSREGRPIKLDGNPDHPANLGSSDAFLQATLLDLYDPDRSQTVTRAGVISDWDTFVGVIRPRLAGKAKDGSGLAILTETVTSPTLLSQIRNLKSKFPGAVWFTHDPMSRRNIRDGLRDATGREILPRFDFSKAAVILSLDCDFLFDEPGHSRYARDFLDGRRIRAGTERMNRLYVVESTHTITGTMADHRWPMRPSQFAATAATLLEAVSNPSAAQGWIKAVADDLLANKQRSLVLAGANQPPAVHAAVHHINDVLGNIDKTVLYSAPVEGDPDGSLADLMGKMNSGGVDTLFIVGTNPCYTAHVDLSFDSALEAFSKQIDKNLTVRLGLYDDETSFKCQWHLPQTHFLEEWSDARAYDGTISTVQPLIAPLYASRSAVELMDLLLTGYLRPGQEILREFWAEQHGQPDFESIWRRSLEKGIWLGKSSAAPPATQVSPRTSAKPAATGAFELVFRADPCIWDGVYCNNAFLQELAKPLTKLTWDNAALISANSAKKLGASNGDMLQITAGDQSLQIPAWILPGVPDDTVTLHLGYGRWRAGSVGTGVGFNVYKLRTSEHPWFFPGAEVRRIEGTYFLVATHTHQTIDQRREGLLDSDVIQHPGEDKIDNRNLVRVGTLRQFVDDPQFVKKLDEPEKRHHLTLYAGYDAIYKNNFAWGMSIDMQSCIGCNACILACQTENNIPVVGKEQVSLGREMHWIRVDTYYEGDPESPTATFHQPVPCQQCENAPCELVCPVGATVHDNEGLNEMVFNRCVGTRYCSNNCPYKVRRFNFLQYADRTTETLKLMRNPEVTVRSRGVMEKCSYCIQRIVATRIDMEILQVRMDEQARSATGPDQAAAIQKQSAELRQKMLDNLQTACQQACPTQAIVFGNLNASHDPIHEISPQHLSEVAQLKRQPLNYSLLPDLTTQPRTTYLARIQNPSPAVGEEKFRT